MAQSGWLAFRELEHAICKELARRVRSDDRPRVNPGTDLESDVRIIWSEHRDKYYEAADLVYRAEGKHPDAEGEEIAGLIGEPG